ncbi:MAG: hypothetical protein ABI862_13925 [Ilumatobacteraceae bacterium]
MSDSSTCSAVNVEVHVPEFDDDLRALAPIGRDVTENKAGAAARAKRQEVHGPAPVWNLVARALGVKTDENRR